MTYRSFSMLCLLALALMPAGCGGDSRAGVKLAAKVNGTEISAQQDRKSVV